MADRTRANPPTCISGARMSVRFRTSRGAALVVVAVTAALAGGLVPSTAVIAATPSRATSDEAGWTQVDGVGSKRSWFVDSWASGDESWHVGLRRPGSVSHGWVEHCVLDVCEQTFPDDLGLDFPERTDVALLGVHGSAPDDVGRWAGRAPRGATPSPSSSTGTGRRGRVPQRRRPAGSTVSAWFRRPRPGRSAG